MSFTLRKVCIGFLLIPLGVLGVFAQDDPDPNSPTPSILANPDGIRVRAVDSRRWSGGVPLSGRTVFSPSRRSGVVVFVDNIQEAPGDGPGAIRVYLRQQSGKIFEIQTDEIVAATKSTLAVKIRLFDPQGYRGQPASDGDSALYMTWRGLKSNELRIGLGRTGGPLEIESEPTLAASKAAKAPVDEFVGYRFAGDRIRFLEQAAFGPTAATDSRLRRIGLRTWLAEQFDMPYPTLPFPDRAQMPTNIPADCTTLTNPTCFREHYSMYPLQKWFFLEAMYGDAQLRHRAAWALSQIWVTSGNTVQQSSHAIEFHKILMRNSFANYREMLVDGTLSPTMGHYLDMVRSTRTNPNENYPREILQLFSIGLFMLNQDGTVQMDNSGQPTPTYSQETVNNFSKVFTGWNYCNNPAFCGGAVLGIQNYRAPMVVVPANHDLTAKTLLAYPNAPNAEIAACTNCATNDQITTYANESLNRAIDNVFNHPNVGPYIGKLMIQHMVTSDPSPAYVSRVAGAFNNNGSGVRGDMRAVIKAILLDPEARGDLKTAPRYGKLREPVQLITNLTRLFPARNYFGDGLSDGSLAIQATTMGQNPFNSPTVFNYFAPDFVVPGTTILAPEFELLNTGMAVKRTNLMHVLIFDGIPPGGAETLRGTSIDLSEMVPHAQADASGNQLLDALNFKMMHGGLSNEQKQTILTAVAAVPATDSLTRVKTAVYLIAASSQYQIQR